MGPGNNIGHPVVNGAVSADLKAALDRILAATRKVGKKCGIYCKDSEQARLFASEGYDMMVAVTDYTALQHICADELAKAKGTTAGAGVF